MTAPLDVTYGRLLRLYPADFRRERGAEMLDTLLEMAEDDGRSRPAPRETIALVLTALRMRAGRESPTPWESWLTAIRTGALMLIVHAVAYPLALMTNAALHRVPAFWEMSGPPERTLIPLALALIALTLALLRQYLVAAVVLVPAGFAGYWHLLAASALLAVLVRRRPLPPSGLLRYAALAPLLVAFLGEAGGQLFPQISGIIGFGLLMALPVAGLLWLAVDERVAMALGLLYLAGLLIGVGQVLIDDVYSWAWTGLSLAIAALPPALLLGLATETARRQAKL
ncbi:hypothetical protein GCM10010168_40030 [Actinoplanes ianthinogenes]|uniref:Uncharacterized protein n=1 Tax=Actinoplanes ianthinogenes TaxID=122358 RepID=A0ABN6CGW4_9ACTN|nr:hypothetical protein [Actinoplanes ianthinogenes]BCJ43688.1 hypothetical protein Aiant_43450 [Actinoplanes ianthinogenes]GGR18331.1 hypothetical protein GCM10010168_40030 [Actinoplanes ianthinogenes]